MIIAVFFERRIRPVSITMRVHASTVSSPWQCWQLDAVAGMSEEAAIKIHAGTLERTIKYSVKTMYGVSEGTHTGINREPLFSTGQGSGASPAAWLTLAVQIMNTMDKVIQDRVQFHSPDSTMVHSRLIDAFVDDTSLSYTAKQGESIEKWLIS